MHWLIINSLSSIGVAHNHDYQISGMKRRWRKAANEVAPGDTVFLYIKRAASSCSRVEGSRHGF
jgi:hypothetical protein